MFPLPTLSVLKFSGVDAAQFLHNQLSSDIAGISHGSSGFACCCNPAGRVLGLLLVSAQEDALLVVCASDLAQNLKDWLSKFIIRADVKVEIRTDLVVLADNGGAMPESGIRLETGTGVNYAVTGKNTIDAGLDASLTGAWREKELKAGITWLSSVTSAQFLPQMLGFETIGALSFKKGCFPGQEIIARTRYLGKLKRRPLLIRINADIQVDLMEKIEVASHGASHGAMVVDRAAGADRDQYLFTIIRADEDVVPQSVAIRGQPVEVIDP